ncbi:hypothetical protein ACIBF1_11275 [Spirillospora sp. NPDC050679]
MNDDMVTEECLRLLRDGLPSPAPTAFEDGRDFLPLALDVEGDVAVVSLLLPENDGVLDGYFIEGWTFHRHNGEWMALGGGGGSAPEDPLVRRSADEMGRHLRWYGSGSTVRNAGRLLPWGAKFVHQARLRAAPEVAQVRVGKRLLEVPEHGHVVVVWGARRGPVAEALDADGAVLDKVDLNRRRP